MTQEEVEKTFAGLSPYLAYKQGLQDAVAYTWDSFRMEAAKDFMTAIIAREAPQYDFACRNVSIRVSEAIMWAEELVKQLKDEKTGDSRSHHPVLKDEITLLGRV